MGSFRNTIAEIFVVIILLSFYVPNARAQTTTIVDVSYPKSTTYDMESETANPPLIVTAHVSFSGAKPGYHLVIGVFDLTSGDVVSGSASSDPNRCVSRLAYAECHIQLNSISGAEHVSFLLGRPKSVWNLALVAGIVDNSQKTIYDSISDYTFTITASVGLPLEVSVPDTVLVTVDGIRRAQGSVRLSLAPGDHLLSVPHEVSLDKVTRLKFVGWSDGSNQANRTVHLNHKVTLNASYVTQYWLAIASPEVNATGAGWYDEGSIANFSVPSTVQPMVSVFGILGGNWRFQGWQESGKLLTTSTSGSIVMDGAHSIVASWRGDYTLPTAIFGLIVIAVFMLRNARLRRAHGTRSRTRKIAHKKGARRKR